MKKITLLFLTILAVSCGNNKEEQMLYDYQQKNVKALNFDLKDLDFKIQKVEKVADITAADSAKHLKKEFAEFWTKNPEQSLVDTLSFKYVKTFLNERIAFKDTIAKLNQEGVLTAIKIGDYAYELKSKRERDKAIDEKHDYIETLSKIEQIEARYDELSKQPESILSTKYEANYTMNNPMMGNAKQTFDKMFYTNAAQTEFTKEEATKEK